MTCRSLNAAIQSAPRSAPTPPHVLQKHSISLIAPAPPSMCKELLECELCIKRESGETTGVCYFTTMMMPSPCKRVLSLPWVNGWNGISIFFLSPPHPLLPPFSQSLHSSVFSATPQCPYFSTDSVLSALL